MVNLARFHTGVREAEEVWDTACGRGLGYGLQKRGYHESYGTAEIRDAAFGSEVFGKLWCSGDPGYSVRK